MEQFSTGGTINNSSLFIEYESGPELIGKINNKSRTNENKLMTEAFKKVLSKNTNFKFDLGSWHGGGVDGSSIKIRT
jgi:hypothetical protein